MAEDVKESQEQKTHPARIYVKKADIATHTNPKTGKEFLSVKVPDGLEVNGEKLFGYKFTCSPGLMHNVDPKKSTRENADELAKHYVVAVAKKESPIAFTKGVKDPEKEGEYKTLRVETTFGEFEQAKINLRKAQKEYVAAKKAETPTKDQIKDTIKPAKGKTGPGKEQEIPF